MEATSKWLPIVQNAPSMERLSSWRNIFPSTDRQDLLLTSGGSTVNVTNQTEDQMKPQVVKKKACNICQKILAPSSYSRHVKDKHAGTQECVVCKKSFITDLPLKIIKGKRMLPKWFLTLNVIFVTTNQWTDTIWQTTKEYSTQVMAQTVLFVTFATPESKTSICSRSTCSNMLGLRA